MTIYGIIDMGLVRPDLGTTPGAALPGLGAAPDSIILKAGNTSRLGFRGRRDLPRDMYARFQIEHRFAADTGSSSNNSVFWLGRSEVALGSKNWGEVYAGRTYSAAFSVALQADPTYWSYVSQLGSRYTYANYTPVPSTIEASNIRWSNALGYKSPVWSGVSFELAKGLGEKVRKNSTSGNLQYKSGPVWLGAAFDRLDSKTNLALVAGGYDFGFVFPKASYSRAKGGVNGDAKAYSVSLLAPTWFGRALVSYGSLKPAVGAHSSMVSAGGQFDLDKSTLLYANVGSAKTSGLSRTSAIDFGIKFTF